MSIHEAVHYYNIGVLNRISSEKLTTGLVILEQKINYMRDVAKQQSVCTEVYADLRKYEAVHKAINELLSITA